MNFKLGNSFFLRYKIIQNNQSRPSLLYMTEIILAAAACQGSVTELRRLGTLSCPDQDIQVEPEFTYFGEACPPCRAMNHSSDSQCPQQCNWSVKQSGQCWSYLHTQYRSRRTQSHQQMRTLSACLGPQISSSLVAAAPITVVPAADFHCNTAPPAPSPMPARCQHASIQLRLRGVSSCSWSLAK